MQYVFLLSVISVYDCDGKGTAYVKRVLQLQRAASDASTRISCYNYVKSTVYTPVNLWSAYLVSFQLSLACSSDEMTSDAK